MPTQISVTGFGLVTPLGGDAPSTWTALCTASGQKEKRSAGGYARAREMLQAAATEAPQ